MDSVDIRIHIVENNKYKNIKVEPQLTIADILKVLEEEEEGDLSEVTSEEYGLVVPTKNPMKGRWLDPEEVLLVCGFKSGALLQLRKKSRVLKIRVPDGSVVALTIDETKVVEEVIKNVCEQTGLQNPVEYSFATEEEIVKKRKLSLLGSRKMDSLKKRVRTNDEINWLIPSMSLREQGIHESQVLVLRKRFSYFEESLDGDDPDHVTSLYNQCKNDVLQAVTPVKKEEAACLAAYQCQVELGRFIKGEHKPGCIRLSEFVPEEYLKSKTIEKRILEEYSKLQSLTKQDAKLKYIKFCRSLKTYGVSFFAVKEKLRSKSKLTPRLLGISRDCVTRVDAKTKEVLTMWPLTKVRRWASTATSFSLDFGGYAESYFSVQTTEGDAISQLLSGYVDITVKKKQLDEKARMRSDSLSSEDSSDFHIEDTDSGSLNSSFEDSELNGVINEALQRCRMATSSSATKIPSSPAAAGSPKERLIKPDFPMSSYTVSAAVISVMTSSISILMDSKAQTKADYTRLTGAVKTLSASVCVLGKVTDGDKLPEAIKRLNFAVIAFLNTLQGDTECKMTEMQTALGEVSAAGEEVIKLCGVNLINGKSLILESDDIRRRTTYMLQLVTNIASTLQDDSAKELLKTAVASMEHSVTVLLIALPMLAGFADNPLCQETLTNGAKDVALLAEKIGSLVENCCNDSNILSEVAEAGDAVVEELQALTAEISKCSFPSLCHHVESSLRAMLSAAETIAHPTSTTADMLAEAKKVDKAFEMTVDLLNTQAEKERDYARSKALLDAAKHITIGSLNVVEGAKGLSYSYDTESFKALKVAAQELQDGCHSVLNLLLKTHSVPRLEVAACHAIAASSQLMSVLLTTDLACEEGLMKKIFEKCELAKGDLCQVVSLLKDPHKKMGDDETVTRLIHASNAFATSMTQLINSAKTCATTVVDKSVALQIKAVSKISNSAIAELKKASVKASKFLQAKRLDFCEQLLQDFSDEIIQQSNQSSSPLSGQEHQMQLSCATEAFDVSKSNVLSAVKGKHEDTIISTTKDFISSVKTWCMVSASATASMQDVNRKTEILCHIQKINTLSKSLLSVVRIALLTGTDRTAVKSYLKQISTEADAVVELMQSHSVTSNVSCTDEPPEQVQKKKTWRDRLIWDPLRFLLWLTLLPFKVTYNIYLWFLTMVVSVGCKLKSLCLQLAWVALVICFPVYWPFLIWKKWKKKGMDEQTVSARSKPLYDDENGSSDDDDWSDEEDLKSAPTDKSSRSKSWLVYVPVVGRLFKTKLD